MFISHESRKLKCAKCGKVESETVFGAGFMGWNRIAEIYDDKTKENPNFCPECWAKLIVWISTKDGE